MAQSLLDEGDYKIILQNRFPDIFDNIKYVGSEMKTLSDEIEGFMGDHFILTITFELGGKTLKERFFLKTIPRKNEITTNAAIERNVYGKEIFFYDFLVKEFEKFGYDTSFAPKCYYCKDNSVLLMEDLAGRDFNLAKKNVNFDLQQCQIGLRALALFHAAGILYEEEMSKKSGKVFRLAQEYPKEFKENFMTYEIESSFGQRVLNMALKWMHVLIKKLPKDEKYIQDFIKRLKLNEITSVFTDDLGFRKTLGHGDLWFNNIFFRYDNSKAIQCCLIDYQILRYFYPAYDVLMYIHLNTNKQFREEHLSDLLQFYYENLTEILNQHGCNASEIFPLADYQGSLAAVERVVMLNVCMCNALVLMPANAITEMFDGVTDDCWDELSLTVTSQAFEKFEDFRSVLTENLYDIYDALIRNKN